MAGTEQGTLRTFGQFAVGCAALIVLSAMTPFTVRYPEEQSTRLEVMVRAIPARNIVPIEKVDNKQVFARTHRAVVTVYQLVKGKEKAQGSGMLVGRDGLGAAYILTNRHVVFEPADEGDIGFKVVAWSGKSYPAELEFYSRKRDLAFLRVEKFPGDPLTVRRDARTSLSVGDQVFALGTPGGMEQTLTAGIVSALRDDFIQTDTAITGGSSGSPLLDGRGWLCGVITKSHKVKNYSFAIYGDAVADLLAEREAAKGRAALPSGRQSPRMQ